MQDRLQQQRWAVVEQAAAAGRLGPGGGLALLADRAHFHAGDAGADRRGLDQEADVDAAHVVTFLQIGHVLRIGLAGGERIGVDARGQGLQHAQAFHFHRAQDVGRVEVVADRQRCLVEPALVGGRGQHRFADRRVVLVVEEALHVVGGDVDVVGLRRGRRLGLVGAVALHAGRGFRLDRVAAEAVVQRAADAEHHAAVGHVDALAAEAGAAHCDHLRVGVPARHVGR